MRFIFLFVFALTLQTAFSQDTVSVKKNNGNDYFSGGGFTLICNELNCSLRIDKNVNKGQYVITHNGGIIAKVNYLSSKEYLIYYYSSSSISESHLVITKIEYFPYFNISLEVANAHYQITAMESYKKANLFEFQLSKEQCYIGILDKKKHKKKKVILGLDFIN